MGKIIIDELKALEDFKTREEKERAWREYQAIGTGHVLGEGCMYFTRGIRVYKTDCVTLETERIGGGSALGEFTEYDKFLLSMKILELQSNSNTVL